MSEMKNGTIVNMGQGHQCRVLSCGRHYLRMMMIGKARLVKDAIGQMLTLGDVDYRIASVGKIITLEVVNG